MLVGYEKSRYTTNYRFISEMIQDGTYALYPIVPFPITLICRLALLSMALNDT